MRKEEALFTDGGSIINYSHCGNHSEGSSKTKLQHDPAVPILGIYPKNSKSYHRNTNPHIM